MEDVLCIMVVSDWIYKIVMDKVGEIFYGFYW